MPKIEIESGSTMRLDKWLWCARFYKTRAIAVEAIDKGHVKVNNASAKPSKEIRTGYTVELKQANIPRTVVINALANTRSAAVIAQTLYAETQESITQREALAEQRLLAPEPATALSAGRPTKRNRRNIEQLHDWDTRWSTQESQH